MADEKKFRKPIGEYLIEKGVVTPWQLQEAMKEQLSSGDQIGKILTRLGYVDEKKLMSTLSQQLKIPFVDLKTYNFDLEVVNMIPERLAKKHNVIAISRIDSILEVATSDPLNVLVIDELRSVTKHEISAVMSTETGIKEAINMFYTKHETPEVHNADVDISAELMGETELAAAEVADEDVNALKKAADSSSVVRLVDTTIKEAVKKNASDIHIEPDEKALYTRIRIDGALYEVGKTPKELQPAVISRIKIMADMDIAERRLPQDGRIGVKVDKRDIELRVSTFPTIHGENVVMRILDKSGGLMSLEQLGFGKDYLKQFREIIKEPHGIVLVTGPTGSGKTTTLYAALNEINTVEKNILTLEEPVEYKLSRIRQTQVNIKAGLTFASGLRHMLRQDPDVMMVGEIRDMETAEMAIRSALTGHLVFSTLHTNDAIGAVTRLIDMGVEPFLVSSSIISVIAQRLVRSLCLKCKKEYTPDEKLLQTLQLTGKPKSYKFYREDKCKECFNIGYRGRTGIFEVLNVDEEIQRLIVERAASGEIQKVALQAGFRSLRQDGVDKIVKGITSASEILQTT
ncbi:MAG: ATPase, T2SS/T4P/T4SS family [Candidatus Omnitrophota bacterium]